MNTRIVVLNAPRSMGAVLPSLTRTGSGATNGVCRVIGAPGTMPVPAPRPTAIPARSSNPHAARLAPSSNAPTVIRPSIYIATPHCGAPRVYRGADRISPVPAVRTDAVVAQRMRTAKRIGGRTVTRSVRTVIRWPQYGGGVA